MASKNETTAKLVEKQPAKATERRRRRPSPSNEEFLDTAFDLFSEQGFERTSIDAITATAGIAKRTVYARYGDKQTLFKAAVQRAIDEWIVPIDSLRRAECTDFEETLQAIAQILVDNIMSPTGLKLLRLTNSIAGQMPELGAFNLRHGTDPTIEYLADLFRRYLTKDGTGFAQAEDAAEAFLYLVVGGPGNPAAWGVVSSKAAIEERTRYSVRLLVHGLLALSPMADTAVQDGALADDNLRLKKLLAESMLKLDQAHEHLEAISAGERDADQDPAQTPPLS